MIKNRPAVLFLLLGAAISVILLIAIRSSQNSSVQVSDSIGSRNSRKSTDRRSEIAPGRQEAHCDPHSRNGACGKALEALARIRGHLLAKEDPDGWVDDMVAFEAAIWDLPPEALASFLRDGEALASEEMARILLPILYIACGRAGPANCWELLAERIESVDSNVLWGLVSGLAVKRYGYFSESEGKKFWLGATFDESLFADPGYRDRYANRHGIVLHSSRIGMALKEAWWKVSTRDFDKEFWQVFEEYRPRILDRIEAIPKGQLPAVKDIFGSLHDFYSDDLPGEGGEMERRAGKWAQDVNMHLPFREWGLKRLARQDLNQAMSLARDRIARVDEAPEFREEIVDWLLWGRESASAGMRSILLDGYDQQKANNILSPRLVSNVVMFPTGDHGEVRIAQDVLLSVGDERCHQGVLDGLDRGSALWLLGGEATEWQTLMTAMTSSPYERIRAGAAGALGRAASASVSDGNWLRQGISIPDPQSVTATLTRMSNEDPSESVRQTAASYLRLMAMPRK